ncbi:hypothetical protein CDEST_05341 [Colletotrichum destructivum]|uniref:Uncharacterized protein n=1 Tax=Colletotrichum destructivum TaxID=34406 RepID=A0AAX4IAU3_9PEZI|nr:hypothetical protein CDEST_05341 [Colletotrichum destructivum]
MWDEGFSPRPPRDIVFFFQQMYYGKFSSHFRRHVGLSISAWPIQRSSEEHGSEMVVGHHRSTHDAPPPLLAERHDTSHARNERADQLPKTPAQPYFRIWPHRSAVVARPYLLVNVDDGTGLHSTSPSIIGGRDG